RRKVEQGWRGEGAPRPRAAAWRRARPGKSRDRTPPEIGLTPEKELLTIRLTLILFILYDGRLISSFYECL
ncbi:MAG: hypothetical protein MUP52_03055, partial [Candidatus Aminicenantes bacterium]|nr:hypothetical protein [Candidatus Aminicenantes bacterium]